MKRILLAATAALAFAAAQPAIAADAPVYKGPAPVAAALFNWSGFYVGLNAGGAWFDLRLRIAPCRRLRRRASVVVGSQAAMSALTSSQAPSYTASRLTSSAQTSRATPAELSAIRPAKDAGVRLVSRPPWLGCQPNRIFRDWRRGLRLVPDQRLWIPVNRVAYERTNKWGWTVGGGIEQAFGGPVSELDRSRRASLL